MPSPTVSDTTVTRSVNGSASLSSYPFWNALFGSDFDLGNVTVTPEIALGAETVQACLDLVSSAIAQVPLSVYVETKTGKEVATDHPLYRLISLRPNRQQSSFLYRKTRIIHMIMLGHAVSEIVRGEGNRPIEFRILQPGEYSILETTSGEFFYQKNNGQILSEEDVIHSRGISLDGKYARGLVQLHKKTIKIGITAQEFMSKYYEKGTHIQGYLKSSLKLDQEQARSISEHWESTFSTGISSMGKTPVLGNDTDFKHVTRTPVESQMVEFLQLHPSKIYQMFRVPPHLVGDTTKATSFGSGLEGMATAFVTFTLLPLAVQEEEEHNFKIFRESEIGKYYIKHNFNGLQRADFAGRMDAYTKGIQSGIYSPNDVRRLEEMNSYDGGDTYMANGNMTPVSDIANGQQNGTKGQ